MKTKNYLGKRDENRGIIAFLIIAAIVLVITTIILGGSKLKKDDGENGISSIDEMYSELERTTCEVNKFELQEENLVIEGALTANLNQNLLSKLNNVQLVFKNKEGDKYILDLDYYISMDGIEFSTILDSKKKQEYLVPLTDIDEGEYFVFLRTKTESSKTEGGYVYKYYTLTNKTENDELDYEQMKIKFDTSKKVNSFLSIVNK